MNRRLFSASTLLSSAMTLLFRVTGTSDSATTLLLHVVGKSVQCFDTSVQYCTVPSGTYCFVLISMPNSIPKRRNYGRLAL